jgi:hypothetical protein
MTPMTVFGRAEIPLMAQLLRCSGSIVWLVDHQREQPGEPLVEFGAA